MAFFNGTCMVEGEGPYTFVAWFYDTGEYGLQDTFSFVSIVYGNFSESDFEYIYNVIISTLFGPRIDGDYNIPFEYSELSEDIAGQYFGMLEEGSDIVIHEPELERDPIYRLFFCPLFLESSEELRLSKFFLSKSPPDLSAFTP
jgi:hypothetical protein